ncbi:MAG: hypothetical protein IJS22_01235 [Lachnospiraceae bacterium]|nr:hypothetical protein [Lachnospiraceae bacterium]
MYYVIEEPGYNNSIWYREILSGLMKEKRLRRFPLTMLKDISMLDRSSVTGDDFIFTVGTSSEWLAQILPICESCFDNRVIAMGNHEDRFAGGKYSIVTTNTPQGIHLLYDYLSRYNKKKIAMYGINPVSSSDTYRKNCFLQCGASEDDMFYNSGSLQRCFTDFSERASDYDAVICVNDYAAISLLQNLPDSSAYLITSCGAATRLSGLFSPSITRTLINYKGFARAGLDLCGILRKNTEVHSVDIYLTNDFVIGSTTGYLPLIRETARIETDTLTNSDKYYSDPEINEMIRIESLLNSGSPEDELIIRGIMAGKTYQTLADELFMSTNGVKYRLKAMFNRCNVRYRSEFEALLRKYIVVDNE